MANGDIRFDQIDEKEFKDMDQSHREWLLYKGVWSMSSTCHSRPMECQKKYVRVRHVLLATVFIAGILVGGQVIQMNVIMPRLVRAAIAAAMP